MGLMDWMRAGQTPNEFFGQAQSPEVSSGPQFSEDRQWWWTGLEWVPASQANAPAPKPKGMRRILASKGFRVVVVVVLALAAWAAYILVRSVMYVHQLNGQ